jgi:hypothetical protein
MKTRKALTWVSVGVSGLSLLGCFRGSGSATVYVESQEPEYVIVREAPPPIIVELRPAPPSVLHIWIDGYWNWNGRYVWERGRWSVPPHEHAVWVAPRYESHEQGYRYAPGHWQEAKQVEKRVEKQEPKRVEKQVEKQEPKRVEKQVEKQEPKRVVKQEEKRVEKQEPKRVDKQVEKQEPKHVHLEKQVEKIEPKRTVKQEEKRVDKHEEKHQAESDRPEHK